MNKHSYILDFLSELVVYKPETLFYYMSLYKRTNRILFVCFFYVGFTMISTSFLRLYLV